MPFTSTACASFVFLLSYRNTVLNQLACVFVWGYFLINVLDNTHFHPSWITESEANNSGSRRKSFNFKNSLVLLATELLNNILKVLLLTWDNLLSPCSQTSFTCTAVVQTSCPTSCQVSRFSPVKLPIPMPWESAMDCISCSCLLKNNAPFYGIMRWSKCIIIEILVHFSVS